MEPSSAAGTTRDSFWQRLFLRPLRALIHQGATPERLSFAVAIGFVLGIFPLLGTTTLLCVAIAAALRLNQVAAQVGNGFSTLFFVVLMIPFVRFGELITGAERFPLALDQLRDVAKQGAIIFFKTFSVAILHGILGWVIAAPVITAILYLAMLPLLRRMRVSR